MLQVTDVESWLVSLGITAPVIDGSWVPPDPDRLVLITLTGGPGLLYERLYDRQTVTVRCRGLQRQSADAGLLAAQVDAAILGALPPVAVGTQHVNDITRGAAPRFASLDKAFRTEMTATYMFSTVT